jgi:hypothetical protein
MILACKLPQKALNLNRVRIIYQINKIKDLNVYYIHGHTSKHIGVRVLAVIVMELIFDKTSEGSLRGQIPGHIGADFAAIALGV